MTSFASRIPALIPLAAACVIGAALPLQASAQAKPQPGAQSALSHVTLQIAASTAAPGAVHGRLAYPDGAAFSTGEITLTPASGPALRTIPDPDGSFLFVDVPAGPFTLAATGDGVEPASTASTLAPGATLELPELRLRLSTVVTSVSAISPEELATEQTSAEEHQRLLGAIPNFFVSYDPRVVPLTTREKFRLSARTLFDPTTLALVTVVAGGEQTVGMYPGFAHGPTGFAERFGAAFTDGATQTMLTGAILPTLFHQDPRYFYQGTGSRGSRLKNVLLQSIAQRGDNGRWQPAWSNTLGDMGSALLSTTYYPTAPGSHGRPWGSVAGANFALGIGSQCFANFLQEFVLGRLTTHLQP